MSKVNHHQEEADPVSQDSGHQHTTPIDGSSNSAQPKAEISSDFVVEVEEKKPPKKTQMINSGTWKTTVFTEEAVRKVAECIAIGMPERLACSIQKPPIKIECWDVAKNRYERIREIVWEAQGRFMHAALEDIRSGKLGWQGAAWILERRHRVDFSKNDLTLNNNIIQNNVSTVNQFALPAEIIDELGQRAKQQFGRQATNQQLREQTTKEAQEQKAGSVEVVLCNGNATGTGSGCESDDGYSFGK